MKSRPTVSGGAAEASRNNDRHSTAPDGEIQSIDELVDLLTGNLPPVAEIRRMHAIAKAIRGSLGRQRQAARWCRYVEGRMRRPTLTAAERRRKVPSLDPDPRAQLAAAWENASERDRRDLITAATRRRRDG